MAGDRDLAARYLGGILYGAILGQTGAMRPADLVRSLPSGLRLGVSFMRKLLEEDDRFVELAGRFDIADRDRARSRPFGGAVTTLLAGYERPMSAPLMASALARIRGGSPNYFRDLLGKFTGTRDEVAFVADHVVDLSWVLDLKDDDPERVLFFNDMERDEELRELWEECQKRDLRKRDPGLTAANILETFERPIGSRQLAFLTWQHHPQIFDPIEFLEQALERDDIVPACGMWLSRTLVDKLHDELRAAAEELAGEGEETPAVDLDEVLDRKAPPTPFKLKTDDRENVLSVVRDARSPIGVDELIIDLLEIRPEERKFTAAAHTLQELLSAEDDLIQVSRGRYLSRHAVPDWVREVPEPLIPFDSEADEDVLIELDALPEDLREAVLDPIYEDICAGVEIEAEPSGAESIWYPLLHHHYVMGTMFIRTIDSDFFADQPPLNLLLMRYHDDEVFPAWLNRDLELLFGLSRWYQRHLPPSGAVFRITASENPDTWLLEFGGATEAELDPGKERLAVLERKRERLAHRPIAIRNLLVELLEEHEEGLGFNSVWAEMNVVRRTSRWQIASLLAFYPCFSESGGRWSADRALADEPGDEALAEHIAGDEAPEEQ